MHDKRVLSLDIASIVSGTKYRGQFEDRMKSLLIELEKNNNTIIFIDEVHILVGAGSSTGSLDASNIFKPSLARGEIHCIGATTMDEYRKYIEKDGALDRRFQKIIITPPSKRESIQILYGLKENTKIIIKLGILIAQLKHVLNYLKNISLINFYLIKQLIYLMKQVQELTCLILKFPKRF